MTTIFMVLPLLSMTGDRMQVRIAREHNAKTEETIPAPDPKRGTYTHAARTRISALLNCGFGDYLDNPLVYKLLKSTS